MSNSDWSNFLISTTCDWLNVFEAEIYESYFINMFQKFNGKNSERKQII